jgi:hypothetical protein
LGNTGSHKSCSNNQDGRHFLFLKHLPVNKAPPFG